ncbi:acyl carrier protein [Chroococcus sp. FPU101]|uniref:acyl carrier protein n=1 Tax=Chroococcus sp. FPU101 TaxID=1974212 RepID=UPI001A8CCC1B|nr:acyl carrier protein [Chroococcus sp. FPU101]GFE69988.1 hypothetical protein CFPU101_25980 [Chroococcus sp. FPU101]
MNSFSTSNSENTVSSSIQDWLIAYLAQLLEVEPQEIDPQTPFERYGLDSSAMVVLSGDLQEWLKCKLDPTLLYDYPTIEALAEHLAQS